MASPILILNGSDAETEAIFLFTKLHYAGFKATTYKYYAGKDSRRTLDERKWTLIEDSFAIVVIASPELFKSDTLVEIARHAKEEKIMIPVLLGKPVDLPAWFINPIDLNSIKRKSSPNWNLLYENLARRLANLFWKFPEPPPPTIH